MNKLAGRVVSGGTFAEAVLGEINRAAIPLTYGAEDYDPLLDWIGSRELVLLGEASHGTHDFYHARAVITRRLITEKGFNSIAIEADWPDAHRVHRFVTGRGGDSNSREALADFQRFPAWMWRNMDVLAFLHWLRGHNAVRSRTEQVGFYGLDLYSLNASIRAALRHLDKVDINGAQRARSRYSCFDHFGEDVQTDGYATSFGLNKSSADEVIAQLVEMSRRRAEQASRDRRKSPEGTLIAEHGERLAQNAGDYYRTMFAGHTEAWNMRDRHMGDTLEWICRQLKPDAKVVVWTHNAHVGDARATESSRHGRVNLGQLVREQHGDNAYLLGFTSHSGEVTAASEWDGAAERKIVRPAIEGSYEALFHQTRLPAFLLPFHDDLVRRILERPMLERAIGVVYKPESERVSHYYQCTLPRQFDAVIHLDRTQALIPFERASAWAAGELPETYPYAV